VINADQTGHDDAGAKMRPDDPDNEDSVNRTVARHKRAESGPNSFAQEDLAVFLPQGF